MSPEHWPREIMVEILCRLPPKTLLRFRCVCKSWHSLIADPSFISLHRRHSPSFFLLELYKEPKSKLIHSSLSHDDSVRTLSDYSLPLPSPFDIATTLNDMICHCHGLLCISHEWDFSSFIICNPSLRRFLSITKPFSYSTGFFTQSYNFAFGFDSQNRDYKIVRVTSMFNKKDGLSSPMVEVYSLASRIWRILPPNVAPVCTIEPEAGNAPYSFVNGLVHWCASRPVGTDTSYYFVLSFDFGDEVFHEVLLPESLRNLSSKGVWIHVVGGCDEKPLTVYHCIGKRSPCTGSIWVMKEYGVVESWNKVFHFDLTNFGFEAPSFEMKITSMMYPPDPLCITKNGKILLLTIEENLTKICLYLLDIERKSFIDIQFGELGQDWWNVRVGSYYAESLVLLNNIDGLVSY